MTFGIGGWSFGVLCKIRKINLFFCFLQGDVAVEWLALMMKNSETVVSERKSLARCKWTGMRLGEFLMLVLDAGLVGKAARIWF